MERFFERFFAVLGALLVLLALWLIRDPTTRVDGVIALVVGVGWVVTSWMKASGRTFPGAGLARRVPRRLAAFLRSAFWAALALLVLLSPGEATPLWNAALVLVVVPLAVTAVVRLWRGPPVVNNLQQLDDALIIEPPERLFMALWGLSSLSLTVGWALAAYLFLQVPEPEWDVWVMVAAAPILALGNAGLAFYRLGTALVPPGRVRLDTAGVQSAEPKGSFPWSEVAAAELKSTEIVLKLRTPTDSIVGKISKEVRITVTGELTDDEQRAIRAFLEGHVAAA